MPKINIRFASENDKDNIMSFIRDNWSSTHILAGSQEFFDYQHKVKGSVTFVIAEDVKNKNILGLIGYIPYSYGENPDIATALWKVVSTNYPMLGFSILKYAISQTNSRIALSCGLNISTLPFYKRLGYTVGKLKHYYRLSDKSDFKIADISNKIILPKKSDTDYKLVEFKTFSQFVNIIDDTYIVKSKPFKSMDYINMRYFNHPIYKYKIFGIADKSSICRSVIVVREQFQDDNVILRIVDFLGNKQDISHIYLALEELMIDEGYEYIDFYQYGISKEILTSAGFVEKMDDDGNIIPNYFEPFVKKNIDIYFYISEKDDFCLFKGDADQDRPNFYENLL